MDYTKGEWELELRPADNVRRVRCNSEIIADVFGTNAEDEANAHLIASAPDLYEALKAVEYTITVDPSELKDHPITASMVREAIAKAEGNVD